MNYVSIKEAAELLGIPVDTVYKQHHRGIKYGAAFSEVGGELRADYADLIRIKDELSDDRKRKNRVKIAFSDKEIKKLNDERGSLSLAEYIRARLKDIEIAEMLLKTTDLFEVFKTQVNR